MEHKIDRPFFMTVVGLALFGFFIFASASLGLLSRQGARFSDVATRQLIVLLVGLAFFLIVSKIDYRWWRKYHLPLFIVTVIATLLVLVPGLGFAAGGAKRWILLGPFSIQPSEFLKLGFVVYLAAWLARVQDGIRTVRAGLLPFLILLGIVSTVMIAQPDIDTLIILCAAAIAMFFVAGGRWLHFLALGLLILGVVTVLAFTKPYIMSRIKTFFNPSDNLLGAGYQVNQSLLAIGAGRVTGRGFGQSIQKFSYLPEPISDSIFSVAAEEFGFIGAMIILTLFVVLALVGLKIAIRAPNQFSRLLAVGIVIMIMTGTFINIASMLGLIPLTGTPLPFISHGGTALLLALVEAGIILNISRYAVTTKTA